MWIVKGTHVVWEYCLPWHPRLHHVLPIRTPDVIILRVVVSVSTDENFKDDSSKRSSSKIVYTYIYCYHALKLNQSWMLHWNCSKLIRLTSHNTGSVHISQAHFTSHRLSSHHTCSVHITGSVHISQAQFILHRLRSRLIGSIYFLHRLSSYYTGSVHTT